MPWTSNSMIITFDGYVKTGISDFSEFDIEVNEKSEKIVVTLPDVEILDVCINHDSVDIYDIEDNVFNPIPVDAQVEMLEDAEEDVVDDALDDGILDKARDRLEELIGSLIESMIEGSSYSDYSIKFVWK